MGVRRNVRIAACIAGVARARDRGGRDRIRRPRGFRERLTGYEEVPALSTTGKGTFRAFRQPLGHTSSATG